MKKDDFIKAYFLRIDEESGVPYQGYIGSSENSLDAEQKYVNFGREDGLIQVVHLNNVLDVICHDEGKILGFPLNRAWLSESGEVIDVFSGNIMVVRHKGSEFSSIHAEDIPYIERYLIPVRSLGKNTIVPIPSRNLPKWEGGTDGHSN